MGTLLLNLLVKYIESHPDQIVELAGEATKAAINAIKKHNASQAK